MFFLPGICLRLLSLRPCWLALRKAAAVSMSLREQFKSFSSEKKRKYLYLPFYYCFCQQKAPYYLVYFPEDKSVCIVQAGAMIEEASCITEPGNTCHVKEKKIYEGIIVTYGKLHCDMKFLILYCT